MKLKTSIVGIFFFAVFVLMSCAKQDSFPVLKGPYFGQKPPGMTAELFASGIVSTGHAEKSGFFSPDGKEFYFFVLGEAASFIAFMRHEEKGWTRPHLVPFSGRYDDGEFSLSPDGNSLCFTSNRPLTGSGKPLDYYNLWVVTRTQAGWSEPKSLDSSINSQDPDLFPHSPSMTSDGTLYFYLRTKDEEGNWDIYYSRLVEGKYTRPERLGDEINSDQWEFDPFIAPDESCLIFCSRAQGGYGASDLYISFRKGDGSWTQALNLGDEVNSIRWEFCPCITPDGRYLFFASNRRFRVSRSETTMTFEAKIKLLDRELNSPGNGHSDFYWVDAKIIDGLKPDVLK
jgi:Tol biopolymer transport system component